MTEPTSAEVAAGVDTINAITAQLAGPQRVWVLVNDTSRDGTIINVYATEEAARDAWLIAVSADFERYSVADGNRLDIVRRVQTALSCEIADQEWYALSLEPVQS